MGPSAIDKGQEHSLTRSPAEDFRSLPSVWLHELTWEEVASYFRGRDTIIVPFGTTEQHGPAGSLGLDGYVANKGPLGQETPWRI